MNDPQQVYDEWAAKQEAVYGRPGMAVPPLPAPPSGVYLGDGLYASFDGYQFRLAAFNGVAVHDQVYLNVDGVLQNFLTYVDMVKSLAGATRPTCPGCRSFPARLIDDGRQAFCANDSCDVIAWNPKEAN